MFAYFVRRLLLGAMTLLLVSFVIYGLIRAMPGSPLDADPTVNSPDKMISQADYDRIAKIYGLDKPWYLAYGTWLGNIVRGDLGTSFALKESVAGLIASKLAATLLLSVTSLLLTYLLAVPMGLYCSARSGKPDERGISTVLYMLYSLPGFVAALYMQLVFAVKLEWLPLADFQSPGAEELGTAGYAWDVMKHAAMPVTVFTYGSLAYYSRFIRANMQEALRQDYVRTARAKGLDERTVVAKHAFRNTLIPLVTLIGLTLPGLLSGAVIIEQIFNWPGMGRLFFDSILKRDYPVIMGLTMMFSLLTLFGQLLADVLYAVVDPRVRLS